MISETGKSAVETNERRTMVWLASFPRSGNTFARNVLHDVYGLESTEVNLKSLGMTSTHEEYPIVKTHLLPEQVRPLNDNTPVIYLVRDGRDALVSLAYHRTNIIEPGSDFLENLALALKAQKGSYFGGWHLNVIKWLLRADLVIRFEDLTRDPVGQFERLRKYYPSLPPPDLSAIPTFESQKFGSPKYGPPKRKNLFFRKGKVGDWKANMPTELQDEFWKRSGRIMEALGYSREGELRGMEESERLKAIARKEQNRLRVFLEKWRRLLGGSKSNPAVSSKLSAQPQLVYFQCCQINDPLISWLNPFIKDGTAAFAQPKGATEVAFFNGKGQKLKHLKGIRILISRVPDLLLRQYVDMAPSVFHFSWVLHPAQHTLAHYSEYIEEPLPDDLTDLLNQAPFIRFIKMFENRNVLSRVISKHSPNLEHIEVDDSFNHLTTRSAELGITQSISFTIPYSIPDDLSNEIMRYNKRDMDLYDHCLKLNPVR